MITTKKIAQGDLKLICMSTNVTKTNVKANDIYAGTIEGVNLWLQPQISLTPDKEPFVCQAWFVESLPATKKATDGKLVQETKINVKVVWEKDESVQIPYMVNTRALVEGERLFREAGSLGLGTAPQRIKKSVEAATAKKRAAETKEAEEEKSTKAAKVS